MRDNRLLEDLSGVESLVNLSKWNFGDTKIIDRDSEPAVQWGFPANGKSPGAMHETVNQVCWIV